MWSSTDIPINEELLQYRATENYAKKDSQQVNLTEGQTVSVIERCDTGKEDVLEILRTLWVKNRTLRTLSSLLRPTFMVPVVYNTYQELKLLTLDNTVY